MDMDQDVINSTKLLITIRLFQCILMLFTYVVFQKCIFNIYTILNVDNYLLSTGIIVKIKPVVAIGGGVNYTGDVKSLKNDRIYHFYTKDDYTQLNDTVQVYFNVSNNVYFHSPECILVDELNNNNITLQKYINMNFKDNFQFHQCLL